MKEITYTEAIERLGDGKAVYTISIVTDEVTINQIKQMRLFIDEADALAEKVDSLIAESAEEPQNEDLKNEDPVVKPKRAPRGSRTRTTAKKKVDGGKIMALLKANWDKKEIAADVGCSYQTVLNYEKKMQEAEA